MARKMTEWPSKRGPITKIMPSDGCIGDTVPLAVGKWYEFHEFGWHMGNVGYIKIVGRQDDMINCGGENVYPKEVENVLMTHANVTDVAVVPVPDDIKGEVPVAFAVEKNSGDTSPEAFRISEAVFPGQRPGLCSPAQGFHCRRVAPDRRQEGGPHPPQGAGPRVTRQ